VISLDFNANLLTVKYRMQNDYNANLLTVKYRMQNDYTLIIYC